MTFSILSVIIEAKAVKHFDAARIILQNFILAYIILARIMKTFESIEKNTDTRLAKLPRDVKVLLEKLAELPEEYQESLRPYVENMVVRTCRRRETFELIQESVAQLRLDMKYLIFDLEATRRERDANQIQ